MLKIENTKKPATTDSKLDQNIQKRHVIYHKPILKYIKRYSKVYNSYNHWILFLKG